MTKIFGKSPLRQFEHPKLKNLAKNSPQCNIFSLHNKENKKSSKVYLLNSYDGCFIETKFKNE